MKKYSFKLNWEHLKAETPKVLRRIGNTLLGVSTFIAGYEAMQGNTKIATAAFVIGVVGKTFVEFFREDTI